MEETKSLLLNILNELPYEVNYKLDVISDIIQLKITINNFYLIIKFNNYEKTKHVKLLSHTNEQGETLKLFTISVEELVYNRLIKILLKDEIYKNIYEFFKLIDNNKLNYIYINKHFDIKKLYILKNDLIKHIKDEKFIKEFYDYYFNLTNFHYPYTDITVKLLIEIEKILRKFKYKEVY
ncbi:hypothetical protein [Mycoplasma sp. CB776]